MAWTDDNGSEFINDHLLRWRIEQKITFTRSRPGNKNDGAHVEQKNWARVRELVGYYRYDTAAELAKLNEIWVLQSKLTNFFSPQQKLIFKERHGDKVIKKHDDTQTPHQRAQHHEKITKKVKTALTGPTRRSTRRQCNVRSKPSPPNYSPSPPRKQLPGTGQQCAHSI